MHIKNKARYNGKWVENMIIDYSWTQMGEGIIKWTILATEIYKMAFRDSFYWFNIEDCEITFFMFSLLSSIVNEYNSSLFNIIINIFHKKIVLHCAIWMHI